MVNIKRPGADGPKSATGLPRVSPYDEGLPIRPKLLAPREKILLQGDTISGKSYAYMRLAKSLFDRAKAADERAPRVFVIDADDTTSKFMAPGYEFEDLYVENGGNVYPYPSFSFEDTRRIVAAIIGERPAPNDWIVVDLANRLYDQCIYLAGAISGKDVFAEAFERSVKGQGFGAFTPDEWNIVKRSFAAITEPLSQHTRANLIFLQHMRDQPDIPSRAQRREHMLLYDAVRLAPEGAPNIHKAVDTVVLLWAVREIKRDGAKRVSERTVRLMRVLKDRGPVEHSSDLIYDRDMYDVLESWRIQRRPTRNVTSAEEAADINDLDDMPTEAVAS